MWTVVIDIPWSVCVCVSLSLHVELIAEPVAIWDAFLGAVNEPCFSWGPKLPIRWV